MIHRLKIIALKYRVWLTLLVLVLAVGTWSLQRGDPYLDQTIPVPPDNRSSVVLDQLQAIAPVIGKKVIFPPGLVDYLSKEKLINYNSPSFFILNDMIARQGHPFTIRDYLNRSREVAGLNWKYDTTQDAIVFDFIWHQPLSRPARELVDELGSLSPLPLRDLEDSSLFNPASWHWNLKLEPSREGTPFVRTLDPSRIALNALMSEPENFPHAWKVRLYDGCCNMLSLAGTVLFGDTVYAHLLKDTEGREHLLVLNFHQSLSTPGPAPTFAYYLFSSDGKWEDGGLFEAGRWPLPTMGFDSKTSRVAIGIVRGGDTYDDYLQVENGKLTADLWKNGTPHAWRDDVDVSLLRHLGD